MCMKNVNISSVFYDDDLSEIGGQVQLGKIVTELPASKDFDGNIVIENLSIATYVSALSSDHDEDLTNEYELLWQFGTIVNNAFCV